MLSFENLASRIDQLKGYILDLQKNMTKRVAIAPPEGDGEFEKAAYLEEQLRGLKFDEVQRFEVPDDRVSKKVRPSLMAKYYGIDKSRTLWLLTHMDVVPAGDLTAWKTPPFEIVEDKDGDTIYGRGVEDNQQAIAAAFALAKALMEAKERPPVNLGVMILADEEVGSTYGLNYLLEHNRDIFGPNDLCIVQDMGDPLGCEVEVAEKSVYWAKFTTLGKQCHSSMPDDGVNANVAAMDLLLRLYKKLAERFPKKDELFNPAASTFVPTKREANVPNVNSVPGKDVSYLDCRLLPCYQFSDLEQVIKQEIAAVEKEYSVQIQLEWANAASSKATDPKHPLVQNYIRAVEKVHKTKTKVIGVGGGTFAAEVRNLGLPAVVSGRTYNNPHNPNEKASLQWMLDDAKVALDVLLNS